MCMLLLCGMPFGKAETTAPLSEELNFQLKEVKPAANPDKALITLDVQENTAERESPGVAIFFDADHTAYGREIPTGYQYTFYQGSAVPEDTISVFEYALPAGSVADANDSTDWIPAFSSGSMELEPGIYDYCVLRPEMENFDMIGQPIGTIIWVTIGADARGDDVEFVGGCEYVFTITRNASSVEQTLLEVISPVDVAVSSLTAPRTGENLTTGETVSISITNEGTETLGTLKVGYKVNGGDAVEEILNHALAPQETYEYSFAAKVDMSAGGVYRFQAWAKAEGDGKMGNDTVHQTVYSIAPVEAPFMTNFDTEEEFEIFWDTLTKEGAFPWVYRSHGSTPSSPELGEYTGGMAAIGNYGGGPTTDAYLITRFPVSLTEGMAHIQFYTYGNMSGVQPETVSVLFGSTPDVDAMTEIQGVEVSGSQWIFQACNVDIPADGGYYFAFRCYADPKTMITAVDNVEIDEGRYIGIPDLAVESLLMPLSSCALGDAEQLGVVISNQGKADVTRFKMRYTAGEGQTVEEEFTQTILMAAKDTVYFTEGMDLSAEGDYTVSVEVEALAQGYEALEDTATMGDNAMAREVVHFSPGSLPFETDMANAADRANWACAAGDWEWDALYGGFAANAPTPLVSRCVEMEAGIYRLSFDYWAGTAYWAGILYEDFDVLFGQAGMPVEDWTVLASYDSAYTESAFVTEEIDFACDEDGLYSIAFVNPTAGAFFMLQSCTLTAIYDHDMRLDSYSSNLARLMPVSFTAEPEFEVTVTNRGADTEEGVKIVVRNGSTVVAESEEAILGPLESHTFNFSGILEGLAAGTEVALDITVELPAEDAYLDNNTQSMSFTPTEDEYAFDNLSDEFNFGSGHVMFSMGNIFSLPHADTITALKLGWVDMSYEPEGLPVGILIREVDKAAMKLGDTVFSQQITRMTEEGFQVVDIPDRILAEGDYYIAISQIGETVIGIACDMAPEGFFYAGYQDSVWAEPSYGYVAVRALFGDDAHVLAKDVEVVSIDRPADRGLFTANQAVKATLRNNGSDDLTGITVRVSVGSQEQEKTVDILSYQTLSVSFEADLSAAGMHKIRVEAELEQDEVPENNSKEKNVECVDSDPYVMDFEQCDDFILDDFIPNWTVYDGDGVDTWGFSGYDFLHSFEPMAFIVYNPSHTAPSTIDIMQAHGGDKMGASFGAIDAPNDNWLISPLLMLPETDAKMTFWVKTHDARYGLERYNVMVSTTDNAPESFVQVGETREAPASSWTEVEVDLSEYAGKAVHVAIQVVSTDNSFAFLIDDIEVSKPGTGVEGHAGSSGKVAVYPNPATDFVMVTSYGMPMDRVEVFNMAGALVYTAATLNAEAFRLSTESFYSGVYMARVYTDAGVQVVKFLVY